MATIDSSQTTLTVTASSKVLVAFPFLGTVDIGAEPSAELSFRPVPLPFVGDVWFPYGIAFESPTIDARGSIRIRGLPGENVAGWTLGFIQLKYVGTNQSRYKGATESDGSMIVTGSNKILCRDTDSPFDHHLPLVPLLPPEVWYDSLTSPEGTTGPEGTNQLPVGTVLPPWGFLDIPAHLYDRPRRWWRSEETNTLALGRPDNFLQHTIAELLFYTMLVAQEPGGKFHILKHFHWNVIWEWLFRVNGSGIVVPDRKLTPDKKGHNIQPVKDGKSNHPLFMGKEFDVSLPVSNEVTRRPPKRFEATDWKWKFTH